MQFLKSFLRGLLSIVFKLSALLLIIVTPLILVFGTAGQIKQSLRTSKIYDHAVDTVIDNASKSDDKQSSKPENEGDNPFEDPAVKSAVKTAVTPAFLQSTSEQIIDGMYGWLQGKTPQPEFNIDVSGVKQQFTTAVGDYAVNRAKGLPICTKQQLLAMSNQKVDALKATCIPAGFDVQTLRSQISSQLDKPGEDGKKNLLQEPVITPDTLPKNDEGKTPVQALTEKASKAPQIFHLVSLLPLLLGGLAVVSGGLIVALHEDKRRGLRSLAWTLLPLGILSLLSIYLAKLGFAKLEKSDSVIKADANIREPLITLVHSLNSAINQKLLLIAVAYVVLGLGTLLVLHFTKPQSSDTHEKAEEKLAVDEPEPSTEPEKPAAELVAKPQKPKNKLIQ